MYLRRGWLNQKSSSSNFSIGTSDMRHPKGDPIGIPMSSGGLYTSWLNWQTLGEKQLWRRGLLKYNLRECKKPFKTWLNRHVRMKNLFIWRRWMYFWVRKKGVAASLRSSSMCSTVGIRGTWGNRPTTSKESKNKTDLKLETCFMSIDEIARIFFKCKGLYRGREIGIFSKSQSP